MVVIYNIYIIYIYNNHLGHFFEIHRHMNEKTFCISCNWLRIHILIHCIWYIIGQEKVNKESRPPPIRAPCPVLHSSVGRWTTCKTSPAFGATGRECCKPGHFLCSGSESNPCSSIFTGKFLALIARQMVGGCVRYLHRAAINRNFRLCSCFWSLGSE